MIGMHDFAVQCYTLCGGKELPVQTGHDLPQATVYGVFAGARRQRGHRGAGRRRVEAPRAKSIGGDALAADTRFHNPDGRNANREEILAKVKAWTKARSVKECTAALDAAEVPARRCRTSTRCSPIRRSRRAT